MLAVVSIPSAVTPTPAATLARIALFNAIDILLLSLRGLLP